MANPQYFASFASPLGELVITGDGEYLTGLYNREHPEFERAREGIEAPDLFRDAIRQMREYFAGERTRFELALKPRGTDFQQRVWQALSDIPHGKTASYGQISMKLNSPGASRAVGTANARNPLLIIVPCHRVVAANGGLSGYAGGTAAKSWLLQHEQYPPQRHA